MYFYVEREGVGIESQVNLNLSEFEEILILSIRLISIVEKTNNVIIFEL